MQPRFAICFVFHISFLLLWTSHSLGQAGPSKAQKGTIQPASVFTINPKTCTLRDLTKAERAKRPPGGLQAIFGHAVSMLPVAKEAYGNLVQKQYDGDRRKNFLFDSTAAFHTFGAIPEVRTQEEYVDPAWTVIRAAL